jgi:hypothetical protein
MKQAYFIGLDTHGSFCVMEAVDGEGHTVQRGRCATNIAVLRAMLQKVPRPCHLVFEEGPLANWLYRNLQDVVDWITVSEPRRNRLISCEGDKDDPLDAAKLAHLLRSGHVKAVHQTQTLDDVESPRQWRRSPQIVGALAGESPAQERHPGSGEVGDRPGPEPVRRPVSEMDRTGPVGGDGEAQRGAEFVGDDLGPVEEQHGLRTAMGGSERSVAARDREFAGADASIT